MIAQEDEKKRSQLWRFTITISTVVIIVVAIFFVVRMFATNPLEGTWIKAEDEEVILTLGEDGEATIQGKGLFEESDIVVDLYYTVDKKDKTISIRTNEQGFESELTSYLKTFNYNLEKRQLTLSEREYGKSLVFYEK